MLRKLARWGKKHGHKRKSSRESGSASAKQSPRSGESDTRPRSDSRATSPHGPPSSSESTGEQPDSKVRGTGSPSLGLHVVYTPTAGYKADIIFVHGPGASSTSAWSKRQRPADFWPLEFLASESDICQARISTFGYNPSFRKTGHITTSVLDFAKDLLFDLKYAKGERKEDLHMGSVPIMLVAHSMGGLIVKEAYLQGQIDPVYKAIINSVDAMAFFATPHRGTNLGQALSRILQATLPTGSKQYESELLKNSFTLQKLNEQFRHVAPKLDIVSFYETQPTHVGTRSPRLLVLEKDSSVLGYPGELSKGLDADHKGICKYDSPQDPNYVAVKNILQALVSKMISPGISDPAPLISWEESQNLRNILGLAEATTLDFAFYRDQRVAGTCEWILHDQDFLDWRNDYEPSPRLLWLNGGPASGKSVLTSFIVNSLLSDNECCQYFFVRFENRQTRSLSLILRSLAYQVAHQRPELLARITNIAEEGIQFNVVDARVIWDHIFIKAFSQIPKPERIFWVLDGIDEADDPKALLRLFWTTLPNFPLKILLTSRQTPTIQEFFQSFTSTISQAVISIDDQKIGPDLQKFITHELRATRNQQFLENVRNKILSEARSNFLWVRLAVEQVNMCHRLTEVEIALRELPEGMEVLYDRMASAVAQNSSSTNKQLATMMLECISCSFRSFNLPELSQVLGNTASGILDLRHSIIDLCGGFALVDDGGNIALMHKTACEYLLGSKRQDLIISQVSGHTKLFLSCLDCLMTTGLRAKLGRNQFPDFLDYAAKSWSAHLRLIPPGCKKTVVVLTKFLKETWVLTWIEYLSTTKQLHILSQASKHLSEYAKGYKACSGSHDTDCQLLSQIENIDSWAVDLGKIAGRLGSILTRDPKSIYHLAVPFCPTGSAIYRQYGGSEAQHLQISGSPDHTWGDHLTRLPLVEDEFASSITAAGDFIAVLTVSGAVLAYNPSTLSEPNSGLFRQEEKVYKLLLNLNGTLLATYGSRTTKVWDTATGNCKISVPQIDTHPRPLALLFTPSNSSLLVGTDDNRIRSLNLEEESPEWQLMADLDEAELEGHILNAPNHMALSSDGTLAAVAYRGHPMSAWETEGPSHMGHCWRKRDVVARGEIIDATWLPHSPEVLGIYIEGVVFRWDPYSREINEMAVGARRLALSLDGNIFATGDGRGAIKVFTTSEFGLLYQLSTQDAIFDISFGPDSYRIYDIRGYYGNVWEPNALLRFAEQNNASVDSNSESVSAANTTSTTYCKRVDTLTTLASCPSGVLYCYGTESGKVVMHSMKNGVSYDIHKPRGFLSIEHLCFSSDGRYICFSDLSNKLFVHAVDRTQEAPGFTTKAYLELSMRDLVSGGITGLMFHPETTEVLVQALSSVHVISLDEKQVTKSIELQPTRRVWIPHPRENSLIVGLGARDALLLDWGLGPCATFRYSLSGLGQDVSSEEEANVELDIDQVQVASDNKSILAQMSCKGATPAVKILQLLDVESLVQEPTSDKESPVLLTATLLGSELSSKVSRVLSLRPRGKLIFLSRTFSVCSFQIGTGQITEFFQLPGDWMSRDCSTLGSVWAAEKSFLCPRNGEVAVVRCAGLV
ncbi:NACHT and WD domain protein [Stachybotrys elegans]|uniref:NACHT and WD domain protein n=1 Tax=Stachybotrys elegans TaxID=80388 RepID=A0A8K0SJD8_9HYPO|nr:NACHT and WD domain protein [Stachybotrys elegans]